MTKDETTPLGRRPMRVAIITLSDRAASGVYEDRSGPRIREMLEEHFALQGVEHSIERLLMPDDAVALRGEVLRMQQAGADVIITTGSTGVGPRDIAPDVIAPLCHKLIPGIMEHIRAKFGAANPRAQAAAAQMAGVIGTTQVYALPGSVKAVEEYLPEILVTLEHLFDTLHGAGCALKICHDFAARSPGTRPPHGRAAARRGRRVGRRASGWCWPKRSPPIAIIRPSRAR